MRGNPSRRGEQQLSGPREAAAIRQALAHAQARLDAGQHVEEDAVLHRDIVYLSSQLAPIRRVPPEILSSIFIDPFFGEGPTRRGDIAITGRISDPIATVSFQWRAITMSTPQFYSTFSVSLSATADISEHLQLYLQRSQTCPLNLMIWSKYDAQPNPHILARLLSTSERWATLHLKMETKYLPLFGPVRGRLPLLECISLHGITPAQRSTTDAFELAPRLTTLDFSISADVLPSLPLKQLEQLSLYHNQEGLALVEHCPNLTSLICTQPEVAGVRVHTNATTVHVNPAIFRSADLKTPKLECLRLEGAAQHWHWSQVDFASFMERSNCGGTLHTLVLDDILIHGNDLIALLPLVPALRTISMSNLRPNGITNKVIAAIIPTDVLPGLETLIVSGSYLFGNTPLLTMLEARAPTLRTITLHLKHREFGAGERDRLRALNGGGMMLSIKCLNAQKEYFTII
ncbi:hypothetical protein C8R46DRAFT_1200177 [Mycena filopes]|nr:hypothetical protein C8R46DRAFT_1200177 [Mycena filopes]